MPLDLARWLPEFPVRQHCLYLNHAAVAPLPRRVADAMRDRIADQESAGSHNWQRWRETELSARALAAELIGCRAEDVSLVRSTSEGLSLIAQGVAWKKGDAVLVGEEEFAANVAPYLALQRRGVGVRRFPTPGGRIAPEAVMPLLKPPVRMLALSWVAFHTGWVAPVAELAYAAHERDVLVVLDAIQGLGVLPDRLDELGVDAMVADGHKWLLGPEGVGVMATKPALRAALHPVLAGWLNVRRPDNQLFLHDLEFHADGRRFEPGATPNVLVAGLAAALDLLLEVGVGEIHTRVVGHARTLTQVLLKAGWRVGSPGSGHPIAGIVAARHPLLPSDDVARRLRERHIEVTARQGWVRFSPHFYATAGELEALGVILGKL
ncbi:MAG: aminotransferase class V-fold PLP-dependent enzyme [Thermoanaerobaculaceae bacterium]